MSSDQTSTVNPRSVRCPKCNAQPFASCSRIKPGRKVQVEYLKNPHPERIAAAQAAAQGEAAE